MTQESPAAELVKLADPRMKAIYDKLAAEGGGTWATYMMLDIEQAVAAQQDGAEVAQLRKFVKELSDALLKVRPLGGSEMFVERCGAYYADPVYCGNFIDQIRAENIELTKRYYRRARDEQATQRNDGDR